MRAADDLDSRLALVRLLLEGQRADEALALLDDIPPPQRAEPSLLQWRALAELLAGRAAASLATIAALPAALRETRPIRWLRARAHAAAGQVGPLVADLLEVIRHDDDDPAAAPLVSAVIANLPQPAQRTTAMAQLNGAVPASLLLLHVQSAAAMDAGDYAVAAAGYQRLFARYPERGGYLLARAAALSALGETAPGRSELLQWLDAHPDHPGNVAVHRALASSFLHDGERAPAVAHYRVVVAAAAQDALARNNLAMLLKDQEPDEALRLAREAHALRPADANIADTLGQVLADRGEVPEAVTLFDQAYRAAGTPTVGLRLAQALLRVGDQARARQLLQALAAEPSAAQDAARALLRDLGD